MHPVLCLQQYLPPPVRHNGLIWWEALSTYSMLQSCAYLWYCCRDSYMNELCIPGSNIQSINSEALAQHPQKFLAWRRRQLRYLGAWWIQWNGDAHIFSCTHIESHHGDRPSWTLHDAFPEFWWMKKNCLRLVKAEVFVTTLFHVQTPCNALNCWPEEPLLDTVAEIRWHC